MATLTHNYKVWIGCLAAYNNGILHGEWVDMTEGWKCIQDNIKKILATSPEPYAEEWEIFDQDIGISSKMSLDEIYEYVEYIIDHDCEVWFPVLYSHCADMEEAKNWAENFQGFFDDLGSYAYDFCESCGYLDKADKFIKNYIDYDSMGRDFEISGDIFTVDCGYKKLAVFGRY